MRAQFSASKIVLLHLFDNEKPEHPAHGSVCVHEQNARLASAGEAQLEAELANVEINCPI